MASRKGNETMKNIQVLAEAFAVYDSLDYEQQETVADFIECPNAADCAWDGNPKDMSACTECKVRWLEQEWEG